MPSRAFLTAVAGSSDTLSFQCSSARVCRMQRSSTSLTCRASVSLSMEFSLAAHAFCMLAL
eukprot:8487902-Alexandrium_andersonii.AAC.1